MSDNTDYEQITAAFRAAGIGFSVIRDDQYWKVLSISSESAGYDGPGDMSVEFLFSHDGSFKSVAIDI